MRVRWGRIVAFLLLTVAATQGISALIATLRGPAKKGDMFEWGLRANLAMLVPGLMAMIFARFVLREPARTALGLRFRPNRWWLVAWCLPALMTLASLGLRLAAPGAQMVPMKGLSLVPIPQPWAALVAGLLAGATVCLPGALGEELAWRGLLRRELESKSFGSSCLIIGLLWAAWHMPAVILGGYAGGTASGAAGLIVYLLLTTPIAMVLCERGRSVLAAALFHASGSGMVAAGMLVRGGRGVLPVVATYLPALVLVAVILALRMFGRGKEASHKMTLAADSSPDGAR